MNLFGNYSFGFIFVAIAVVHFIRRRPETYWLFIIIMGGGIGALIYIVVEVIPDLGLLRQSFQVFSHRKRIRQLEVMVLDNPSAGNYEELADLYLEQKKFGKAKECYDRAISSRTDSPDPFYRRAVRIGIEGLPRGGRRPGAGCRKRLQLRLSARGRIAGIRMGQQ